MLTLIIAKLKNHPVPLKRLKMKHLKNIIKTPKECISVC